MVIDTALETTSSIIPDRTLKIVPPGKIPMEFSNEPLYFLPQLEIDSATKKETLVSGERFGIRESAINSFVKPLPITETNSASRSGQSAITEVFDTHLGINVLAKISLRETNETRSIKDEATTLGQHESFAKPTVLERTMIRINDKDYDVVLMKKIEGVTLKDIHDANWKFFWGHPDQFARIARGVATNIDTVHSEGMIHGDIKPANIMISDLSGNSLTFEKPPEQIDPILEMETIGGENVETFVTAQDNSSRTDLKNLSKPKSPGIPSFAKGQPEDIGVKIIDFGSAKKIQGMTVDTNIQTTPYYAAPEVLTKKEEMIDKSSDIHSLGMTMYQLLTDRSQENGYSGFFGTINDKDIYAHMRSGDTLAKNRLPDAVYTVIQKATAYDQKNRYETATAFIEELLTEMQHSSLQTLE